VRNQKPVAIRDEANAATLAEEYRAGVGAALGLESVDMADAIDLERAEIAEEMGGLVNLGDGLKFDPKAGVYTVPVPHGVTAERLRAEMERIKARLGERKSLLRMPSLAEYRSRFEPPVTIPVDYADLELRALAYTQTPVERFRDAVASFEIREPLKSMCQPTIEFRDYGNSADPLGFPPYVRRYALQITLRTAHRNTGEIGPLMTSLEIPEHLLAAGDEKLIHLWIRSKLKAFLTHELDESIHVRGERVFDPHDPLTKNGDAL
jgi:hypothetical protein